MDSFWWAMIGVAIAVFVTAVVVVFVNGFNQNSGSSAAEKRIATPSDIDKIDIVVVKEPVDAGFDPTLAAESAKFALNDAAGDIYVRDTQENVLWNAWPGDRPRCLVLRSNVLVARPLVLADFLNEKEQVLFPLETYSPADTEEKTRDQTVIKNLGVVFRFQTSIPALSSPVLVDRGILKELRKHTSGVQQDDPIFCTYVNYAIMTSRGAQDAKHSAMVVSCGIASQHLGARTYLVLQRKASQRHTAKLVRRFMQP